MDKDIAHLVTRLRKEIAAFDPGQDLARIGILQMQAGALYAISMAARNGYLELARSRPGGDAKRERALGDAALRAVEKDDATANGAWVGDFYFGSALLRVAAAIHGTLKHRYLPLFGEGFCRSRVRLEEQACRDGLISESDRLLLTAIREDADRYKHDLGNRESRTVTSLNDLAIGLRVLVGVAHGFPEIPKADAARG